MCRKNRGRLGWKYGKLSRCLLTQQRCVIVIDEPLLRKQIGRCESDCGCLRFAWALCNTGRGLYNPPVPPTNLNALSA